MQAQEPVSEIEADYRFQGFQLPGTGSLQKPVLDSQHDCYDSMISLSSFILQQQSPLSVPAAHQSLSSLTAGTFCNGNPTAQHDRGHTFSLDAVMPGPSLPHSSQAEAML